MLADGGGLYLQVTAAGSKSWIFRFTPAGRAREMGLGPAHTISLSDARSKATTCRRPLLDSIDPIDARKAERDAARLAAAKSLTFAECAAAYTEAHKAGWRNDKHVASAAGKSDLPERKDPRPHRDSHLHAGEIEPGALGVNRLGTSLLSEIKV